MIHPRPDGAPSTDSVTPPRSAVGSLALGFMLGCGLVALFSPRAEAIIQGERADAGWEAVGSLRIASAQAGHCSATLIAPDWIITAEHCRHQIGDEEDDVVLDPSQMVFQIGDDWSRPAVAVRLKKWVAPPAVPAAELGREEDFVPDVAFAQLAQPIQMADGARVDPIPLAPAPVNHAIAPGDLQIVGFGETSAAGFGGDQGRRAKAAYTVTTAAGSVFLGLFSTESNFENYLKIAHPGEEKSLDRHLWRGSVVAGYELHAWDSRGREGGNFVSRPDHGWANSCFGDSGGPLVRTHDGQRRVIGIIAGGFNGSTSACVALGSIIGLAGGRVRDHARDQGVPGL